MSLSHPDEGAVESANDGNGSLDLDLLAAALRTDEGDTTTFFEVLGAKLADILGKRVVVDRAKGRFRKDHPIEQIVVTFGNDGVELSTRLERGQPVFRQRRVVRGIALSDTEVGADEWIAALVTALSEEAQRSEATRQALQKLVT